jgi:hypothetical protein
MEKHWLEVSARVNKLETELARLESLAHEDRQPPPVRSTPVGRFLRHQHVNRPRQSGPEVDGARADVEQALIAVPNLSTEGSSDRNAVVTGLSSRYSAIWTLADQGASPEAIARATGQPAGQIELILGLRRQIDGTRTAIAHSPHV